jgi:hypothetical protein
MAKPVKKNNLPVPLEDKQQMELSSYREEFELLTLQEKGSELLSVHFGRLNEAFAQISAKKRDCEDQIVTFLQKNMAEPFPELFICQLSRFYPFSPELLQKHIHRLNEWHLEVNFHVWTNDATKKVMKEYKPTLNWAIEGALCYVEDPVVFIKYADEISNDQKSTRWYEYDNDWNSIKIYKKIWKLLPVKAIIWNNGELIKKYKYFKGEFPWLENTNLDLTFDYIKSFFNLSPFGYSKLADNFSIEWTDEMKEFIKSKVSGTEYEIKVDESIKDNTTETAIWKRISNDRYREWYEKYINENKYNFDWKLFSCNPGLPYSVELLNKYRDYWDVEQIQSNKGLYDKALSPLLNDRIVDQLLKLCY